MKNCVRNRFKKLMKNYILKIIPFYGIVSEIFWKLKFSIVCFISIGPNGKKLWGEKLFFALRNLYLKYMYKWSSFRILSIHSEFKEKRNKGYKKLTLWWKMKHTCNKKKCEYNDIIWNLLIVTIDSSSWIYLPKI